MHAYPQRPSQGEIARLLHCASSEILDLGAVLTTCASYLVTTERPALYRDAVLAFLERGGTYRCVLLDPASQAAHIYSTLRQGEDIPGKINQAIASFGRFKQRYGRAADGLHGLPHQRIPRAARPMHRPAYSTRCDPLLPYLFAVQPTTPLAERGDMPHYLATHHAGQLFTTLTDVITHATTDTALTRIL